MRLPVLIIILLNMSIFDVLSVSAQNKEKECEGEFSYFSQRSDSQQDCERIALDGARIDALRRTFGSVIEQNLISSQEVTNDKERMTFNSISSVDVKGEWLKDIESPSFKYDRDSDGTLIVTCKVKILARSISNRASEFQVFALRNAPNIGNRDSEFRSGERIYLYFSSPIDGYVQVYLIDTLGEAACLLPYPSSSSDGIKVKGGKEYILFDKVSEGNEFGKTKEYILETDDDYEYNRLVVLFSPNPFSKASVKGIGVGKPLSTTDNEFTKWRLSLQRKDPDMGVKELVLRISKFKQ